jgi:hypothetical protein
MRAARLPSCQRSPNLRNGCFRPIGFGKPCAPGGRAAGRQGARPPSRRPVEPPAGRRHPRSGSRRALSRTTGKGPRPLLHRRRVPPALADAGLGTRMVVTSHLACLLRDGGQGGVEPATFRLSGLWALWPPTDCADCRRTEDRVEASAPRARRLFPSTSAWLRAREWTRAAALASSVEYASEPKTSVCGLASAASSNPYRTSTSSVIARSATCNSSGSSRVRMGAARVGAGP